MASDWIKVRTCLPSDGRLKIVSRRCHASTVTVFGALVTVWCLADAHANENGELVGYSKDDIDALVGVENFCDSLPADWLDASGEWVKLPDYQEHNGQSAKTRAQATKRQKASRSNRDTSVTREEKRREEKNSDSAPAERSKKRVAKSTIPADFGISDRVRQWAREKGFGNLDQHLDSFKRKAAAKGYEYVDWDAAFMEAIREDWAKLRQGQNRQPSAPRLKEFDV
jgi:hypothetical protein